MNADTITTDRLADLEALLESAVDSISRLRLQAINGDISMHDAAAIVKDTAETITNFAKTKHFRACRATGWRPMPKTYGWQISNPASAINLP